MEQVPEFNHFNSINIDGLSNDAVERARRFLKEGKSLLETFSYTNETLEKSTAMARDFIKQELGENCDSTNVYIIDEQNRDVFFTKWEDHGFIGQRNDHAFYEPLLNAVVIFYQPSRFHRIVYESTLVHELTHSTSRRDLKVVDKGNKTLLGTHRIGFAVVGCKTEWGNFLEEGFCGSLQAKYLKRYAKDGSDYWSEFISNLESVLGWSVSLIEDPFSLSCFLTTKKGRTLPLPVGYLVIDKKDCPPLVSRRELLFAAAFDVLSQKIPNFREMAIKAREDYRLIKKVATMINEFLGRGSYVLLQKQEYYGNNDGATEAYEYVLMHTETSMASRL